METLTAYGVIETLATYGMMRTLATYWNYGNFVYKTWQG